MSEKELSGFLAGWIGSKGHFDRTPAVHGAKLARAIAAWSKRISINVEFGLKVPGKLTFF